LAALLGEKPPPVSFDGGARPLIPAPRDPVKEHNEFVLELIQQRSAHGGGGGGVWSLPPVRKEPSTEPKADEGDWRDK
jgi:hypothetical protein